MDDDRLSVASDYLLCNSLYPADKIDFILGPIYRDQVSYTFLRIKVDLRIRVFCIWYLVFALWANSYHLYDATKGNKTIHFQSQILCSHDAVPSVTFHLSFCPYPTL